MINFKQLFCNHNWIIAGSPQFSFGKERAYTNEFGATVHISLTYISTPRKCTKCGKKEIYRSIKRGY